jgi:hypothetical protein
MVQDAFHVSPHQQFEFCGNVAYNKLANDEEQGF